MKKKVLNPFICQGYESPEYFCDREEETASLMSMLYNGRNVTLVSPRRLGKTGLIWNTFHKIRTENKDAICIYIDIFPTKSQSEFVKMLGEAVVNGAFSKGKAFGMKAMELLGSLRPTMGMDYMTGLPSVTLNVEPSTSEMTMRSIFSYLNKMQKEVFVAIDEFQQVASYPESGTEALLRSYIQFSQHVHFVFSGSRQHLMSEMFVSPQRPFYQSTDMMSLSPLNEEVYYHFANDFFEAKKGSLDRSVFGQLYNTFNGYTWYVQTLLNRLYEAYDHVTEEAQLKDAILKVVESKAVQYESLVQFLSNNQFSLLKAIAKEDKVEQPMAKDFIRLHQLPSASSVRTALDMLVERELVYQKPDGYIIYDRFLDLWLKRL